MNSRFTARRPANAVTLVVASLLALMLLAGAVLVVGCSSSESTGAAAGPTLAAEDTSTEELATAVVDIYGDAMQELVALLGDRPDAAAALPDVQTLREDRIQKLVALGHQRETLSESDQAQVDSLVWSKLGEFAEETWYEDFNSLWRHYSEIDLELANLIASFNTLTQYSDFELLRTQSPDEAERLGVGQPE